MTEKLGAKINLDLFRLFWLLGLGSDFERPVHFML